MSQVLLRAFQTGTRYKFPQFGVPIRSLFSREELGITQIESLRQKILDQFKSHEDVDLHKKKFVENFTNLVLDEKRDNLKEYIILIDKTPDDLKTLKSLLMQYHDAYYSITHNVKEFCFGAQIMRMFYLLNLPDEAVKFYKDKQTKDLFKQKQTYKVMLSLLYENKRYAEVFELYREIRENLELYELVPDQTMNCLAFAACYQLNTPEHFQYAQDLFQSTKHMKPLNRSTYLLAGLALKQNEPTMALNLLPEDKLYVTIRFIKFIANTQCGRFDRACEILSRTVHHYNSNRNIAKPYFGIQMVEDLRKSIEKSGSEQQLNKFNEIYEDLKSSDLLNDDTLDQHLCATFPPMLPKNVFLKMKEKHKKTISFQLNNRQ